MKPAFQLTRNFGAILLFVAGLLLLGLFKLMAFFSNGNLISLPIVFSFFLLGALLFWKLKIPAFLSAILLRMRARSGLVGTILLFFFVFIAQQSYAQGPKVDNNLGTWVNSFNDPLGTNKLQNTVIDPFAGIVQLQTGQNSGSARTVVIDPTSADAWKQVCITATYSSNTDLTVDILNAADSTVIPGYSAMSLGSANSNGCFDISGINFNTYRRLMVRINFTKGNTAPTVSELKVTWNPVTYILFDKIAPLEVQAGQGILYRVRVSANFVNAKDLVIWDVLPTNANGLVGYKPGENYGQNDAPTLATQSGTGKYVITNNGQYTASAITVKGVSIPAGSVYWSLDSLPAGQSISLRFLLNTQNGTLDSTKVQNRAYFNVANGDDGQSALKTTYIRSTPAPAIDKLRGGGIIPALDTNFVRENSTISFRLYAANGQAAEGRERMYNTVMWDNLNDLAPIYALNGMGNPIVTNISGNGQYTAVSITVAGHSIPANSVYWSLGTFDPGANVRYHSFSLQINSGAPYRIKRTNTVYLISDQTSRIQASLEIAKIPDFGFIAGSAGCSKALPDEVLYNRPFTGGMGYSNNGVGTLRNNVIFDRFPNEMTFLSASFQAGNNYNGQIWYFRDLTGTYTNPLNPPLFDFTNPAATPGIAWTQTPPTDNNLPNESIWVAYFVPAITSSLYDTDPNLPSSIGMNFTASIQSNSCISITSTNQAVFRSYGFTAAGGGTTTDRNYTQAPLYASTCGDQTRAIPVLPAILPGLGGNTITNFIIDYGTANYTAQFVVNDNGTGLPINNVVATIQLEKIDYNGKLVYPALTAIGGTPISNYNPTTGTLTYNLGTLYNGDGFNAQLSLQIPPGVPDGARYGARVSITGDQASCPVKVNVSDLRTGIVTATERVQVFKNDVVSLIESGGEIDYKLSYRGIGPAPSRNTWVVDRIPFETALINANAPNGERVWFTDKLPPNMPSNQISVIDPVDFSVIQSNFTPGIVNNNGTPNNYADDIITSPFGAKTTWIAWNVDDRNAGYLPISAAFKEVGFKVKNDLDGPGANTVGSPSGTVIFNEEVIFSDNLLQAVGNEVRTTILDYPGLFLAKRSDKEILSAGQSFNWIIDYYNSSDAIDDVVKIMDKLPAGVTINSVSHQWNAKAIANGKPSGLTNITANSNLTVTNNADGTTSVDLTVAGSPGLIADLLSEEGGSIYLNVKINNTVPSGTLLVNNVRGVAQNNVNTTVIDDQDAVSVFNPDLSINKLIDDDMPNNGDMAKFTLVVANMGLVDAPSVVIKDVLPAGASYVTGSTKLLTGGYTLSEPSVSGRTLTWSNLTKTTLGTAGTVPAQSGPIYITYMVNVSGMSGDMITNRVSITTPLVEDNKFPNQDSVKATIPYPDPTVLKTGTEIVDPGAAISYTITYRNLDNYDAANVYILETLPDFDSDGKADVSFVNTTPPAGVTPYFSGATGAAPAFTPANPTANGWSATPTSPVNHIAYLVGKLVADAGPANIALNVNAAKPGTGVLPSPGTQYVNKVSIFTSSTDGNPGNNTASHTTITPGVDIGITKMGSVEGTFPGLRPGDTINYTIRLTNTGSQNVYGVRIEDALPPQFVPFTPLTTFATVRAFDARGAATSLLDPTGANLSANVPVTQTGTSASGQTVTWYLGSTANTANADHYRNVGLPVGAYVEFVISGTIAANVSEGSRVTNKVTAIYDGPVGNSTPEQFLNNNTASTSVNIYQPELVIHKEVLTGSSYCQGVVQVTPIPTSPLYINSGNFGGLNNPALNSSSSWSGTNNSSTSQFVGMRWTTPSQIVSVTTQGRADQGQWVTSYDLQATTDGTNWQTIATAVAGNTNQNTQVTRTVSNTSKKWVGLRINPKTWNGWPSLRFGFTTKTDCDTITNEFVSIGDTLTYQIAYNNIGNADAENVSLEEIIPAGTKYIPGSLVIPPGSTASFTPNATNPTAFTLNLGTLSAPATFDGGIALDRTFYLDSIAQEGLDTNRVARLRYYGIEPAAVGTVGNPAKPPVPPKPAVPAAPQPAIPAAPQPPIPAAPQPPIPAAPQPPIPAAPQPPIPAAPQPPIPAAPGLKGGVTLGVCNCATQTAIPQIECEALVALYNSTNGASSWPPSGWGTNNNPASWPWVGVSGGRVTSLNLGSVNLTGSLPAELGNLTELISLDLNTNWNLVGPPPAALGNLTKLRVINMTNTQAINGPLPAEWWNMGSAATAPKSYIFVRSKVSGVLPASWGNMTNLGLLWLHNNGVGEIFNNTFTGPLPPEWGNMTGLQTFYLYNNNINAPLPAEWWKMGSLATGSSNDYRFQQAGITGTLPASWGNMTKLYTLQLHNGAVTGTTNNTITGPLPPEWGNMTGLQSFLLFNNKLNASLPAEWWKMGSLSANHNYQFNQAGLTGTLPASWGNMTKIDQLLLNNQNPTGATNNTFTGPLPPEWGNMASLRVFSITNNNLNSSLPAEWWGMGRLGNNNGYNFAQAGITGTLPASWGNMTKLNALYLYNDAVTGVTNNSIVGPLPPEWGNMTGLQSFLLYNNKLNASLPSEWWKMGSLTSGSGNSYWFQQAGITGALPASWGNMTKLNTLYLHNNAATGTTNNTITGSLPPEWGNMTALQTLALNFNNLNATLPAEWWNMGSLASGSNNNYQFQQTGITGPLPASWGNMSKLRILYLHNNAATGTTNNSITGPLPSEWGNMTGLNTFSFYYNNINDTIPATWWKMGSLTSDKDYNWQFAKLVGPLPASFGASTRFSGGLYLNDNKLSGPLPPEWGNLRFNGGQFFLSNNQLTCAIPEAWANIVSPYYMTLNNNKLQFNGPNGTSSNPVIAAWLFAPGRYNSGGQTPLTETEVRNNSCTGAYPKDGVFGTPIVAGSGFQAWDRLFISQELPKGTTTTYSLYNGTISATGGCTGTPIAAHQNFTMEDGVRDISDIPTTQTNLCMQVTMTSDRTRQLTPVLKQWRASYRSSESPKITFQAAINKPLSPGQKQIDNTARITTTTPEKNPNDNEDAATVYVYLTDLAVTKTVDKAAVMAVNDETITYTLNYEALGPQDAINPVVVDVLPANTLYKSAIPAPTSINNNYQGSGRTALTWNLSPASMPSGTKGAISIVVQETNAATGDNLLNNVTISNDRQETNYDNNGDEALTVVGALANVYIKKDGPSVVEINGSGQFTLQYGNNGNLAAANTVITDNLPVGFKPISATDSNGGSVSVTGQNVTLSLGAPLAAGAKGTITINFSVANNPALVGTVLNNVAEIRTTSPETDISDNRDNHLTPVELLHLAALSGLVWHDDDRDGVVDPAESPIPNVTILLRGTDIFGKAVTLSTTTDLNGKYNFPGLNPGTYNVEEVQPAGILSTTTTLATTAVTNIGDVIMTAIPPQTTTPNVGIIGSGVTNPVNEAYNNITLNPGDRGVDYNFGEDYGSLGDTAWVDVNRNGLQDATEKGVPNVTVRLYLDKDMNALLNPLLDSLLGTTFTNPQGYYGFNQLLAGKYFVVFDSTSFPALHTFTIANAGGNDADDSDINPKTGASAQIVLAAGVDDPSIDLGIAPPCVALTNPSAPQKFCAGNAGSNISVDADYNTYAIRFVRFSVDQMAGAMPTPAEAAAIYSGGTTLATVTISGTAAPFKATLTAAAANWTALPGGTYYVYAILNPDLGASCRPVQEVVVTIVPQANAGADGSTTVCDNSSTAIDLFSLISGEQAGGVWSRLTGSGGTFVAATGTFTPAPGASTSTFQYEVTGSSPCPKSQSVATVNIVPQANAGADGSTTVCDNSSTAIDLFSLISGEQLGGTWTRLTGTGGTFVAATGKFTPAPGATSSTFQYEVTGSSPCPNDQSVATVNIVPQANAGADGSTTVCDNSGTAIDLYSLISGEQLGGTWTRLTGTGGSFVAATGKFTPAPGATSSTFQYEVTGSSPCPNDQSVATVNIVPQANAGTDGSTTVCDNSSTAIDLYSLISGEQLGGTWTRLTGAGGTFVAATGKFTPAPGATSSTFQYEVTGSSPCPNDQSVATVNIVPQANAGSDGSTTVCDNSSTAIDLYSLISGEQLGGTWTRLTGTGGTFVAATGTYTPAPGATSSTFQYEVTGSSPCPNDQSVATVNLTVCCVAPALTAVNASICSGSAIALPTLVQTNTPAGVLTFHTSQADATAGTNALVNTTVSPTANTRYYVRSTTGAGNCFSTAVIDVTIVSQPILKGIAGVVCGSTKIDLSTLVTANSGGTLSYYTTLANAQAGINALPSSIVAPASATNYYVRSTNGNGCSTVLELKVTIQAQSCGVIQITGPNNN